MIKDMFKNFSKFKYILLFILAILLTGAILVLGWINHADFERSVINAELRELQVIAKSAGEGIKSSTYSIKQEPGEIAKLVEHINNEETLFSFIMDDKHIILSHPVKSFIGRNILEVSEKVLDSGELSRLAAFVKETDKADSGTAVLYFPSDKEKENKAMTLFAFSRLINRGSLYSIVVGERLAALTTALHRHLKYTLLLVGLFFLVFFTLGCIFYYIQKRRINTEVTARALEIINKQLHCQIDDYKRLEKKLRDYKG
ncbi:MAG: hypothetical protein WC417_00620 [Candidatus Omnitrophota bacterium]|jgi:hypothetical protein